MQDFLEQSHEGMLEQSMNNNNKPMYYDWTYVSTNPSVKKYEFTLNFYRDAAKTEVYLSLPVVIRNPLFVCYIDVIFTKDDYPKAAAMRYRKDGRWALVKFVPHPGCRNEKGKWERVYDMESFDQLLKYMVTELDNNVNFDCYVK
jgi:hypothetical protein